MRSDNRDPLGLRPISFEPNFIKHAEGSCFVRMGNTWVLATASVEEKVPPFLEGKKTGWITAEYSMLPRATHTRKRRESTAGRPDGRSQEIQRLIGRALRACIDTTLLGERTITIDCDVIQADGGTRIASINGGFVALAFAVRWLAEKKKIATSPVKSAVAGISVAMKSGEVLVDPDYDEDSTCDVDMNLVMLEGGRLVELQGTGEGGTFSPKESQEMLQRAMPAISKVIELQRNVCG